MDLLYHIVVALDAERVDSAVLYALDVAIEEMRSGRYPKEVHVLFKEPAQNASEGLISFKENFYNKYQLHPKTFNNISLLRKQVEDILQKYINK